jgi:hypothetical protein
MARPALRALDTLELLGVESLLFISDEANGRAELGRANGLDDAAGYAADAAIGLTIAPAAPEGTPAAPADLPDAAPDGTGPADMNGVTLINPVLAARGGGGGGGGGKPGGGGGGSTVPSSYISGDPDVANSLEFNVEIVFKGTWTDALQNAFISAADYLSTIITGDIADVFFRGKVVDDIRIDAELKLIDGEGGILGQAGPTAYRTANYLPATAVMQFDSADAAYFDSLALFDDIVLHEMLHSIGFGTMWDLMGLTEGSIADGTLVFIGDNAEAAYDVEFGGTGGVPIETDGGSGTAGGHWDDDTFQNELMTGYIGDPDDSDGVISPNYVSAMTVAALEDMGYATLWEPNDPADNAGILPDPINGVLIA